MWINWKPNRTLGLQAENGKLVKCVPGTQYIDDTDWNFIRPSVLDKIKRKELEVIGEKCETDRKGAKGNPLPDRYVETPFEEMDNALQEEVITSCLSMPCLIELKKVAKESVRILIVQQIDKMNKRDPAK